jgi:hypothetical protein
MKTLLTSTIYTLLRIRTWLRQVIFCFPLIPRTLSFQPLPGDNIISSKWLTEIMSEHNLSLPDETITSITLKDLEESRGLVADIHRIHILLIDTSERTRNVSLILKRTKVSITSVGIFMRNDVSREALFYDCKSLWRGLEELRPQVYHTYSSSLLCDSTIVMEDMTEYKADLSINMVLGNQMWGIPSNYPLPGVVELDVIRDVFSMAAKLHAAHWRDPALLQLTWLRAAT